MRKKPLPLSPYGYALYRIRAYAMAKGWPAATTAAQAGINERRTRGMFSPDWAPKHYTIVALEAIIPADWKPGDPVPQDEQRAA